MRKSKTRASLHKQAEKSLETRRKILEAGTKIWPDVTMRGIAEQIGITHPAIVYHFGDNLKDAIAAYAVESGKSRVIAQLIATKHPAIRKMSIIERQKHMDAVS